MKFGPLRSNVASAAALLLVWLHMAHAASALPSLRIVSVRNTVHLHKVEDPMEYSGTTKNCAAFENSKVEKAIRVFKASRTPEIQYWYWVGFTGAHTMKRTTQLLAILVGGAFIAMQGLSNDGSVDYEKLNDFTKSVLDVNVVGKAGGNDYSLMMTMYRDFDELMEDLGPSGAGFALGLVMGLQTA
jgi:uncharacterized membrane protein (Fun14 family)